MRLVLMTQRPTFEKIVALYLYLMYVVKMSFVDIELFFDDLDGDTDPSVPDIDTRKKYPTGSSAAEVVAKAAGIEHGFVELLGELNKNNATGCLKDGRWAPSFVALTRRMYDLRDPAKCTEAQWRRIVIGELLEVAELCVYFYSHLDSALCREQFVDLFPQYEKSPKQPFCLGGYAYTRFMRGDQPSDIEDGIRKWTECFDRVKEARKDAVKQVKDTEQVSVSHIGGRDGHLIAYVRVQSDLDVVAVFKAYPKVNMVVAYDTRGSQPSAAIQTRSGKNLKPFVEALYRELARREPEAWHIERRVNPGPTPHLLNGSTSRRAKAVSHIAGDRVKLMSIMVQALDNAKSAEH